MRLGSLFTGLGGLDLGIERSGLAAVAWQVEINPFRRAVLAKHWPGGSIFQDVRSFRGSPVDVVCGGFPCQNLSRANVRTRTGLSGPKSGLWSEFSRVISESAPRFVVVENVYGAWRDWVPTVRQDLRRLGYTSLSICLRASDLGAPFQGARVFVVAETYTYGQPVSQIHAQVAKLSEIARDVQKDWGNPPPRALGVADGVPSRMERLAGIGDAVVPAMAEVVGRYLVLCRRESDPQTDIH